MAKKLTKPAVTLVELDKRLLDLEREWFNPVYRYTVPGWLQSLEKRAREREENYAQLDQRIVASARVCRENREMLKAGAFSYAEILQRQLPASRTFWGRLRWLVTGR